MTYIPPQIAPLSADDEVSESDVTEPVAVEPVAVEPVEATRDVDVERDARVLTNRLAAIELRLRLAETGGDPVDGREAAELLGLLRAASTASGSDDAEPIAEVVTRVDSRAEWAAEALQSLTESLARARAQVAEVRSTAKEEVDRLAAMVAVEASRARNLEAALARTYSQAQQVQSVAAALEVSRSMRMGRRLARATGRSGPSVSPYELPIAEGADPEQVALVCASGLFDAQWYQETYPDIVAAGADPLGHFMTQAASEHRCPGPLFDTGWYVRQYADHIPDGMNPLVHYLLSGWREGFRPWESFDPEDYLRIHPQIAQLDLCPLVHLAATVSGE